MPNLSRLAKLGLAPEATPGTYLAPTISVPWNSAKYNNVVAPLEDKSYRANDSEVQGIVPGPSHSEWDIGANVYADLMGHFLKAVVGSDTVTGGVSTTLSSASTSGATSISVASQITQNTVIRLGSSSTSTIEYAKVTASTGSGPYTLTVTGAGPSGGLLHAHASGDPVVSATTHTFAQSRSFTTVWPTYSLTTDDGVDQRGWTGCVFHEMAFKCDPKGLITADCKAMGQPAAAQSTFSYAASDAQPLQGWTWTVSNGGASSDRGISLDLTFKRSEEAIHASTGSQAPRSVFAGPLTLSGKYTAIFEDTKDAVLFRDYTQDVTTHTFTQPFAQGGAVLTLTMSKSGYTSAEPDLSKDYAQLDMNVTAIHNPTDSGLLTATLSNFKATAY